MASFSMFKLSFFLSLLSNLNLGLWPQTQNSLVIFPPSCNSIECPIFDTVEVGNGYEVRRYKSTEWMSTSPIQDISLVEATRTGFLQKYGFLAIFGLIGCTISFGVSLLLRG